MEKIKGRLPALLSGLFIFAALTSPAGALSASGRAEPAADVSAGRIAALQVLKAGELPETPAAANLPVPVPSFLKTARKTAGRPVVVTVAGLASKNIAGGMVSAAEGISVHDPDTYLPDRLAKLPPCAAVTAVPFVWGRTFGDTQNALYRFVPQLIEVYDTYKNTGRPVYVLAHSWGAVLMHDVLHRVARLRPDVKIDKFITIGTPLVPRVAAIGLITGYQVSNHGLLKEVSKPANVLYWKNIWASRDPFSNAIPAADSNVQLDAYLGLPEYELSQLSVTRPDLRLEINKEIALLDNSHAWHKSYYRGFKASLPALNEEIDLNVFDAQVAPQLAACMAKNVN
ncbi:MAG: hypothetical protein NTY45_03860 [Elusimicrobia bacterium]|nr:hypothetical protein [Elusimicrobiota bacterium]